MHRPRTEHRAVLSRGAPVPTLPVRLLLEPCNRAEASARGAGRSLTDRQPEQSVPRQELQVSRFKNDKTDESERMKINGNEIKPGNVLQHQDTLWAVVKAEHVKPGKGGAFAQVEMKNLIDGRKLNERFRSADKVERVRLEQKDFQYLYPQEDMLVFMDTETYEQIELQSDFVGERAAFLQDGMMVTLELHEERPIGITLPQYVTLEITEADAVVKGQTQSSSYKPAILENGVRVMVPPFITAGERIVVDTELVEYVRRAD